VQDRTRRPEHRGRQAVVAALAAIALAGQIARPAGAQTPAPAAPPAALVAGMPFPSLTRLKVISTTTGPTATEFSDFDLSAAAKDKFLLLCYWMPDIPVAEDNLKALAAWAKGKKNFTIVSVVPPRGKTSAAVLARAHELGFDFPIVWDDGYQIGNIVRAATVPHFTVVDPQGVTRMIGAAGLKHEIQAGLTFNAWLDTAAHGKGSPSVPDVPRYYPVRDLIDQPFIDFTLNRFGDNRALRFSEFVRDGRLTLLVFWSADCPHCQKEIPILNEYYMKHQEALSVVGVIRPGDAGLHQRTTDFLRISDIKFPTVVDQANKVWAQYRIVTTPTTVVVTPNGVVSTVLIGADVDLDAALGPRIAEARKGARPGA
jgi:thiol-disulfide isomerase/thioredoxin